MPRTPHALEHTAILSDRNVWHYTCNSPSQKILDKYKIKAIGTEYGVDPREVLLIPQKTYEKFGYQLRKEDAKAVSEALLRRLR